MLVEGRIGVELPALDAVHEIGTRIGERLPIRSALLGLRPRFYRVPEDPFHGLEHAGLVLPAALVIGRLINQERIQAGYEPILTEDDFRVLEVAGPYHDSHSLGNQEGYAEHGTRAAQWVEEHLTSVLSRNVIIRAAYVIRHHVPDDDPNTMDDLLAVFKDADSAARVRFGNEPWGLNPHFLRYDVSRQLLIGPMREAHSIAASLRSEIPDGFTRAIEAHVQVGFVLDQ